MYVVFKKSLTAFPGHQASSDAGLQTPTHPCRWKPLPGGSPNQCLPSPSVCSLGLSMPYDGIHHGPWNIEIQVLYSLTLLHHLIPFFEMINFFFFQSGRCSPGFFLLLIHCSSVFFSTYFSACLLSIAVFPSFVFRTLHSLFHSLPIGNHFYTHYFNYHLYVEGKNFPRSL